MSKSDTNPHFHGAYYSLWGLMGMVVMACGEDNKQANYMKDILYGD